MNFRVYLCPNGHNRIVRVIGVIPRSQEIYCSTHNYHVVDIATGKTGIVSGMFLRHTTAKDW